MAGFVEIEGDERVRAERYQEFERRKLFRSWSRPRDFSGVPVIHVASADAEDGVRELLKSQVPYERSLGMASRWIALAASDRFFSAARELRTMMSGASGSISADMRRDYLHTLQELRSSLKPFFERLGRGVLFVHGIELAPLVYAAPPHAIPVLRIHGDHSAADPEIASFIRPFAAAYRAVVASTAAGFAELPASPFQIRRVIHPAIDPLTEKNREMPESVAWRLLDRFSIHPGKPLLAHVSRFDVAKHPHGALDVYRRAKQAVPDLQFVFAGFLKNENDPASLAVFRSIHEKAREDKNVRVFAHESQIHGVPGGVFINALHTASAAVFAGGLREGFGLTATEAMWKGKSVVAWKSSGSEAQIAHGTSGFLATSADEAASAITALARDPELRARIGKAARESVLKKFLLPRFAEDHVALYDTLIPSFRRRIWDA